jgi:enoyl-CoA hydratase/carnithine racemase
VKHELQDLRYIHSDGIARLTLARPAARNAIRRKTVHELHQCLQAAEEDGVRVLVLDAEGPAFCAGQDLAEARALLEGELDEDVVRRDLSQLQALTARIRSAPFVSLAAVQGPAVGLGAELAVACDLRIAAPAARFGFVEVTVGLFETNGVLHLLPALVGLGRARRLMFTGEVIGAEEAERIGLVEFLAPGLSMRSAVDDLATTLAAASHVAVAELRRALADLHEPGLAVALDREVEGVLRCLRGPDAREGLAAALEHRPAVFGRS